MKEINKHIGLKINELRNEKELTLDQLAAEIGVSRQMVWNWENHVNEPGGKNLSKIAKFLQVSIVDLLGKGNLIKVAPIDKPGEKIQLQADIEFLKRDMDILREERDALLNKLLLQHEKYQTLKDNYDALKFELQELKNNRRTGTD